MLGKGTFTSVKCKNNLGCKRYLVATVSQYKVLDGREADLFEKLLIQEFVLLQFQYASFCIQKFISQATPGLSFGLPLRDKSLTIVDFLYSQNSVQRPTQGKDVWNCLN